MFIFIFQSIWLYIDNLAGKGLDLFIIGKFIFYLLPNLTEKVLPLTVLLSSILTFGTFAEHYEFAAMKASGISLQRSMRTLIVLVSILGLITFYFADRIIPAAELKSYSLKKNIAKVKLNHIQQTEKSFRLTTNSMTLFNNSGNEVIFNQEKVLQFLNAFKLLNCESFKDEKEKIEFAIPLHELIVNNDTLRTYSIGNGKLIKDKEDNSTVKRMHATLNNGELMLIQDYVFNKVLITIDQLQ